MVSLLLSSFVLVMANVKGLHADLASVQGKMTVSDSASTVIAYWQKMLPNSPMPIAILELLTSTTGNVQVGRQSHYHVGVSRNIVFLEDALKPGSTITPYILSSATTSGAPLLRRDVADFIPMSTRNFTDILEMFAPMSQAMAVDIWRTLEMCEHLRTIQGEKKACATSVESMVEFAASVLTKGSTRELQAFSSPEVPAEGVTSGNRYKVAAVSRTTESNQTMTCHGLSFPYASFMCHAVNPTRVYTVTLESEEMSGSGGAEERMEVLAVCHLETSEFDPLKMPCEVEPGKAPVCHFVSRDSDLWAAAAV